MLTGIRIFSTDQIWRGILSELGATIAPDGISFDSLDTDSPVSVPGLKSIILNADDVRRKNIINKICGACVTLSDLQTRIIVALHDDARTMPELKDILGFAPGVATHVIDTAIYNLRKTFGRDFIKFGNGKYSIGV